MLDKVSIIVNWNGEHFLERCLVALMAQTVKPYEFPRGFKFMGVQLGVYFLH